MINIVVAEVGGKGKLLIASVICDAILKSGLEIKSYNRVGLVQRNGAVYSTIRIGKEALSPEIPTGCGDIMLGLEPLEAYRRSNIMRKGAIIILNDYKIYPSYSLYYENTYPKDIKEKLEKDYKVIPVNFKEISDKLVPKGCIENYRIKTEGEFIPRKLMDVYLYSVGILAQILKKIVPYNNWMDSIEVNVPICILDEAKCAFNMGYNYINPCIREEIYEM